jgi:adenylate cyclase class IV
MKEPEQACPLIDKAIKNFKYAEKEINNICESLAKADALKESASDILYQFNDINFIETLEELRTRCSALREWGNEWQSKAEKLEEELKKKFEELTK